MSWNNDPKALQAAIESALGPEAYEVCLRFRLMFGGAMSYAYGRPFASLSNAGMALKLAPTDRQKLMDEEGAQPLRYNPSDPPSKSYTLVPESWHHDPEALLPILKKSIEFCATLPVKKKRK